MATLTSGQLAKLRTLGQRTRISLALFGVWRMRTFTVVPDESAPLEHFDVADYHPVINLGSHRLAFQNESIALSAVGSFYQGEGLGAGTVSGGVWDFDGGTSATTTGIGPHDVTWATTGLKTISYTLGGVTWYRWVRVLASRDASPWDVVSVSSLQGSDSGGWSCELVIAPSDDAPHTVAISDYQMLGLFAEDQWETAAGVWTTEAIGSHEKDPTLLMVGQVKEGSIHVDHQSHRVTLTIETTNNALAQANIHKTAVWRDEDTDSEEPPTTGTLISGLAKLTMPDVVLYLLQEKTNYLEMQDFFTWWNANHQSYVSIEGKESDVWSVLESYMEPEFGKLYVDNGGGLYFAPDRQVRRDPEWETGRPLRMTFTAVDLLDVQVDEDKQRDVVYVKLVYTNTRTMRQRDAEYPDGGPSGTSGDWIIKKDLLGYSDSYFEGVAQRIYTVENRKYEVTLSCALNRAIAPGDLIQLTATLADRGITWTDKAFIVDSVTLAPEPGLGQCRTTIHALEDVISVG